MSSLGCQFHYSDVFTEPWLVLEKKGNYWIQRNTIKFVTLGLTRRRAGGKLLGTLKPRWARGSENDFAKLGETLRGTQRG